MNPSRYPPPTSQNNLTRNSQDPFNKSPNLMTEKSSRGFEIIDASDEGNEAMLLDGGAFGGSNPRSRPDKSRNYNGRLTGDGNSS